MKKFFLHSALVLALGAWAAAQTTPTTTPSNTNNTGTANPTQQSTTPTQNPNSAPAPDTNANPSSTTPQSTTTPQSGTTNSTGSATTSPDTNKSGDADQNTATTPATTTTQSTTTSTTTTQANPESDRASNDKSGKDTVTGCLESASNGNFTIRDKKGRDVQVSASSMMAGSLSDHVGERVRARGSYNKGTESASNTNSSSMPQSDQPGKSDKDANAAPGTTAKDNPDTNDTSATSRAQMKDKYREQNRNFTVDSISTLSKTCGNNDTNNPK